VGGGRGREFDKKNTGYASLKINHSVKWSGGVRVIFKPKASLGGNGGVWIAGDGRTWGEIGGTKHSAWLNT